MKEQPCLPFDFYQEERDAFLAGLPHYDNPETDNERLLNFQWEYFTKDSSTALGKFYDLLREIAYKMINTETHRNKHIRGMPAVERETKAHNAAMYMIEQLLSRQYFYFGAPDKKTGKPQKPTGYLFLRVYHEIYYKTAAEKIQDFVDLDLFFKEGTDDEAFYDPELYRGKTCGACAYCSVQENKKCKCLLTFEEIDPRSTRGETCAFWEEAK